MGLIRLITLLSNPFVIAVIILVCIGSCMPEGFLMNFLAGVTAIVIIVGIVMMFVKLLR